MNADDGSGQTNLSNNGALDSYSSWSPDGKKIAFSSTRANGEFDIYVMNADDGSGQTRLTDNPAHDGGPDWGSATLPPSPAQATEDLISDVGNLDHVPQSVKTSLTAPFKGVSDILNDDNPNNDKAACGKLGAFINQVDANEKRGTLTADQADNLRTQAQDIRNALGC
jgi:hypothetical protein